MCFFRWTLVAFSFGLCVLLTYSNYCGFLYYHFLIVSTRGSRLILYFSSPSARISLFSKEPGSFNWRIVLETKIWALVVLIATRVLLLQGPFSWQSKEIYVCILTCAHTHTYKYLCNICISIKLNMSSYWCLIHHHINPSNLLPLLICTLTSTLRNLAPSICYLFTWIV